MSSDKTSVPFVNATVKWFNNAKGFGFVTIGEGEEAFVHFSEIEGEGYKSLNENEPVECRVFEGPKGRYVTNVRRIGASA